MSTSPTMRTLILQLNRKVTSGGQLRSATQVNLRRISRRCRSNRQGAAAVEFALVVPVFFLMVFGMIEFGARIMVQQLLTNAAREGAGWRP